MTEQVIEEFTNTDAGASLVEPTESQRLKNGSLVMIKGFPCKVTEVSTAKPGKHGSAKVILKGRDIFTAKVYECTYHSGDMVDAPIVARNEYTLLNIDDETLELLDSHGEMKCDVNLPVKEHLLDVKKEIIAIFEEGKKECLVTILGALGHEQVIEVRSGQDV
jgi:translation initiation factor 5A|tara:strand:+ start:227 stop:715 length:489 start_codon:yes stop_codon:yes gene_type:complete